LTLAALQDAVADCLLAMVLAFLFWGMWQFSSEVTACLVVASVVALRLVRPHLVRLADRMHLRLNQMLEWPLWRRIAAVHEAGHVVVAHRLGIPVSDYALTPAASALNQPSGYTRLGVCVQTTADPERLLCHLTVLLAGKVTEEMIFGRSRGAAHDLRQFEQWARVIDEMLVGWGRPPVGVAFWQQICEERARGLLSGRQALIEEVARAMLRRTPLKAILAEIDANPPRGLPVECPKAGGRVSAVSRLPITPPPGDR
jgi:hypothetical protein